MSLTLLKILADFDTQLATAASIGGTTSTLVSATDDDGNALPTGTYGLTIDAGNSSKEYIICTLTGTALTSILSITRQGVTSSGFARTHRRGAKVTVTDWAILSRILNNLDGTTGFNSLVKLGYDADPGIVSGDVTKFATVQYVNDTTTAGAPDASTTVKGISRLSTSSNGTPTALTSISNASPAVLTLTDHGLTVNDSIILTTTGTLPTGLSLATTYYVISAGFGANSFEVSATLGGSAINTSSAGSGTHSFTKTTPIAVGTFDPRVPTQSENDALVGTSGTPSSSNKYVTNDDTSTTSSGSKIPRGVSGKIDNSWFPSSVSTSFTMPAGENITAGQALYAGVYQSTPILYDNSATFINSGVSSSSNSFTVGSGSNKILIVSIVLSSGTATVTSAQYSGIAMTLLQSDTSNTNGTTSYLYSITNPTSGANNLTFSYSASINARIIAYSFANVSGVSTSNKNIGVSSINSVVESNINTGLVVGFGFIQIGGLSGSASSSSVELPNNNIVSVGLPTNNMAYFGGYSNQIDVAGSSTFNWTFVTNLSYFTSVYSVSLTPSNTAVTGYARLATASNSYLGGTDRYTKFIGFATTTTAATNNATISAYLMDSLSGLTGNSIYYLSDTPGAIATSAGTNSKKVGIAISATSLILKDSI